MIKEKLTNFNLNFLLVEAVCDNLDKISRFNSSEIFNALSLVFIKSQKVYNVEW